MAGFFPAMTFVRKIVARSRPSVRIEKDTLDHSPPLDQRQELNLKLIVKCYLGHSGGRLCWRNARIVYMGSS